MEDAVPTVYVVDDEPDVLRALSRLLRSEGLHVQAYADGLEFLEQVGKDSTGCVILDLSMPVVNGLVVQRRLAEKGCRLPIVFLSGDADARVRALAMQRGAMAFLSKPVDAEVLLDAVRPAVAGRGGSSMFAGAEGQR